MNNTPLRARHAADPLSRGIHHLALDGDDVQVLERWTQTRDEALAELRTLCGDGTWLDRVTAHLPQQRGAA